MLPAIAVILWCNLLAVLGNGYLQVIALEVPAKKAKGLLVFTPIAVIALGLASWQAAEVTGLALDTRERLEKTSLSQKSNPEAQKVERQSAMTIENCSQDVEVGIHNALIRQEDRINALQDCLMGNVQ